MKVYIVGDYGYEHNNVRSVYSTHEGALKAWNKLRLQMLASAKHDIEHAIDEDKEMYEEPIKILSCEDPDKMKDIEGFIDEMPYIEEHEVIE